jgi:hypothetical protein
MDVLNKYNKYNFTNKKFIINNPFNGYNKFRNDIIYKFKDYFHEFKFYGNDPHAINYFKKDIEIMDENEYNINKIPPYDRTLYKINKFNQYKFILIIENQNIYSYVSEKIIDGLLSCSLPIYFGFLDIDIFFPDLFDNAVINGSRYSSIDLFKLLENMTEDEYNKRLNNINKIIEKYLILFSQNTCIKYSLSKIFDFVEKDEYTLILENANKKHINK